MKRMILSACLLFMATAAFAQTEESLWLTGRKWMLKEDVMSGLGTHQSLPQHTQIEFFTNGKWSSNEPLAGFMTGAWLQDKKGKIWMYFSDKRKATVWRPAQEEMKIMLRVKTKKMLWAWTSKG